MKLKRNIFFKVLDLIGDKMHSSKLICRVRETEYLIKLNSFVSAIKIYQRQQQVGWPTVSVIVLCTTARYCVHKVTVLPFAFGRSSRQVITARVRRIISRNTLILHN